MLSFNELAGPCTSRRSVTPGHALLFRKDIRHRAKRIIKGHKTMSMYDNFESCRRCLGDFKMSDLIQRIVTDEYEDGQSNDEDDDDGYNSDIAGAIESGEWDRKLFRV